MCDHCIVCQEPFIVEILQLDFMSGGGEKLFGTLGSPKLPKMLKWTDHLVLK